MCSATESLTGQRAMVSGPMRLVNGRWETGPSSPRRCPKCSGGEVYHLRDDAAMRVLDCADCGAIGVISKGKNGGGPWWYHDWQYPVDMAPAWARKVLRSDAETSA